MENNTTTISIVVPVYNAKPHLLKLIQCLQAQTVQSFEVIFVDDGSTDGSSDFLDAFTAEKLGFAHTVIHQANGGVSAARNRGIEAATGKYLCFLDADDEIASDYLQLLKDCLDHSEARVVMGYITRCKEELALRQNKQPTVFEKTEFLREFLYRGIHFSICAGMYEAACFREYELRFPVGYQYSEDVYLLWQLFAQEAFVAVVPCALYYYYDNPASAMNKTIDLRRSQAIELMRRLEPIMQQHAPMFSEEYCAFAVARHHWSILWQAACMLNHYTQFKEYSAHFSMKSELKKLYRYPSRSVSWSARLYCAAPWLYYRLIRIYKRKKYI